MKKTNNMEKVLFIGYLKKTFMVIEDKCIFKLEDCSYWIQEDSVIFSNDNYIQKIKLVKMNERIYLLAGDATVLVSQLHHAFQSRIFSFFKGWTGHESYSLSTGEIITQLSGQYIRKCVLSPSCLLFYYKNTTYINVSGTCAEISILPPLNNLKLL
ncbi:hypothetical protein LYY04_12385 [Lactococcus lactis]|uniref:hypothetical protein n=1 Tax=Lactococcus lactis TaxID=1358 RepID=UPI001F0F02A0|nr:hypothetical protein [Lactococcus lactis]MCH5428530.1 hypothetical protein [Lactococcus lactis]